MNMIHQGKKLRTPSFVGYPRSWANLDHAMGWFHGSGEVGEKLAYLQIEASSEFKKQWSAS